MEFENSLRLKRTYCISDHRVRNIQPSQAVEIREEGQRVAEQIALEYGFQYMPSKLAGNGNHENCRKYDPVNEN